MYYLCSMFGKNAQHLLTLLTNSRDVIHGTSLYAKLFVYL